MSRYTLRVMAFRRAGKSRFRDRKIWDAFRRTHAHDLARCGLPEPVLDTRGDWEYFLMYGYHTGGGFIDFSVEELSPAQCDALRGVLHAALTEEQKARGGAVWHFLVPPIR
jgi:hypothetical protein